MADTSAKKISPFRSFLSMVAEDRREVTAILVYSLLNSLLLLAVPLAAQGLVNVVVAGLFLQPLIVLTLALFFGLLFAGFLTTLRFYLVEVMKERVFARVALRVSERLPRMSHRALTESSGPELMNRFFDVINIQKSWFKLAYDGPGAVLEVIVGLCLLALYGVELWTLACAILLIGGVFVLLAGYNGLQSSIDESKQKYRVAEWLEEMARCQNTVKLNSRPTFWSEETDRRVVAFLTDRRRHFRILLRQHILYYSVAAFGLAGMLGMGGYLVIDGQLSLGQLVAAELVVWSILKATEKGIRIIDAWFDLLTGLDKVGYITGIPVDKHGANELQPSPKAAKIMLDEVTFRFSPEQPVVLDGLDLKVSEGEILTVLGAPGCGKTTLIRILAGFLRPQSGCVEIDDLDLRDIEHESLTRQVGIMTTSTELFAGTLEENVMTGRATGLHRLREVLSRTEGRSVLHRLENGTGTILPSGAQVLSASQRESILLSRAVLDRPRLLLVDEALYGYSENQRREIARKLASRPRLTTLVSTVALPELLDITDRVIVLDSGKIVEEGSPHKLAEDPKSRFSSLYPSLALYLRHSDLIGES